MISKAKPKVEISNMIESELEEMEELLESEVLESNKLQIWKRSELQQLGFSYTYDSIDDIATFMLPDFMPSLLSLLKYKTLSDIGTLVLSFNKNYKPILNNFLKYARLRKVKKLAIKALATVDITMYIDNLVKL